MAYRAKIETAPPNKIQVCNNATCDAKAYGAIANGKNHPLSSRFNKLATAALNLAAAKKVYPHVQSLDEEIDWAALQMAANAARDWVRTTLSNAAGNSIAITSLCYTPRVYVPPGNYILNRPVVLYPHVSIEGCRWGDSKLYLSGNGWAATAPKLTTNPQGVPWIGPTGSASSLIWVQGDEAWPIGGTRKVAGMTNFISHLGFTCHNGASIFIAANQNMITIRDNWLRGWGVGPTGWGIVANNATSSTQITNLSIHENDIEGMAAAIVLDKVEPAHICGNQFESCQNGVFVAHGSALHVEDNIFTNFMGVKPFLNGVWVGVGYPLSISNNTFKDIEVSAIKILGRATTISDNRFLFKNPQNITKQGCAIHVVTQANQFGGDVTAIKGKNGPHSVTNNVIDSDTHITQFPIYFQAAAGQTILSNSANNFISP